MKEPNPGKAKKGKYLLIDAPVNNHMMLILWLTIIDSSIVSIFLRVQLNIRERSWNTLWFGVCRELQILYKLRTRRQDCRRYSCDEDLDKLQKKVHRSSMYKQRVLEKKIIDVKKQRTSP
jgi:hypothetical protein